jgi:Adenylate and Guanylate cyclase catalytic domain
MNDRINKTSICSIVFLDIIDYSKKPDSEQLDVKNQFNAMISLALKDIAQNDRIILDTGDGAAIACNGSPEDALFISLTIRDEILKSNLISATPLFVRIGINLGPVRVVNDINGQPNIIGDGINVAQRIMSFAKPNQVLVSRSYYEVTSRLTQEISQLFDYSGIKHDKHVREHEVYSVRSLKNQTFIDEAPDFQDEVIPPKKLMGINNINWKYAVFGTLAFATLFGLAKLASNPVEPAIILQEPTVATQTAEPAEADKSVVMATPTTEKATNKSVETEAEKSVELKTEKAAAKDKSGWTNFKDSVKTGTKSHNCTQAQVAMGQCR